MLPLILVVSLLGHCAADILDNGITCHSEVDLSPDTLDYLQQRGISLKNSPLTNTQCSSLPDAWGNVSCVTLTAGSETIKGCSNDPILMSLELCKHEQLQGESCANVPDPRPAMKGFVEMCCYKLMANSAGQEVGKYGDSANARRTFRGKTENDRQDTGGNTGELWRIPGTNTLSCYKEVELKGALKIAFITMGSTSREKTDCLFPTDKCVAVTTNDGSVVRGCSSSDAITMAVPCMALTDGKTAEVDVGGEKVDASCCSSNYCNSTTHLRIGLATVATMLLFWMML
ncbi:hypothetical protein QR680_010181 [Steinernema hermaphroditum]|uniref:SUEL-type lectin domain-containing protein n=1 Tax=Steinernema hermaphroditum TaxID=289476 RepID=A0AA39IPQ3_9BILA|nr:hypothetical protein QR680_010181 [Steinernema hermaphroditum]